MELEGDLPLYYRCQDALEQYLSTSKVDRAQFEAQCLAEIGPDYEALDDSVKARLIDAKIFETLDNVDRRWAVKAYCDSAEAALRTVLGRLTDGLTEALPSRANLFARGVERLSGELLGHFGDAILKISRHADLKPKLRLMLLQYNESPEYWSDTFPKLERRLAALRHPASHGGSETFEESQVGEIKSILLDSNGLIRRLAALASRLRATS